MQHLWDTRNLIVHSQCVASFAYAKKYAHMGFKAGEKVKVDHHMFGSWLDPVETFMVWTEAFFLDYGGTSKTP